MLSTPMLYGYGDEPWVLHLGIWEAINYAPLLVQRQHKSCQFALRTHRLSYLEFTYGTEGYAAKVQRATKAWKEVHLVGIAMYSDLVTPDYLSWINMRVNDIVLPVVVTTTTSSIDCSIELRAQLQMKEENRQAWEEMYTEVMDNLKTAQGEIRQLKAQLGG
ncbi:hypothetical protein REPUB_Repub05bG0102900 [Reevesia pubescens]